MNMVGALPPINDTDMASALTGNVAHANSANTNMVRKNRNRGRVFAFITRDYVDTDLALQLELRWLNTISPTGLKRPKSL